MSELWYRKPAQDWSEALPIGNGRLGAMVYGRTTTEILQLNENSVWYGGPQDRTPKDALSNLSQLRELIRSGNHEEAEKLVRLAFFATPSSQRHYEPLATAFLEFGHQSTAVKNYRRSLDLENAISKVDYDYEGIHFTREMIASKPDGILAMRVTSSKPTTFTVRLTRVSDKEYETNEFVDSIHACRRRIILHATPGGANSNKLCTVLSVRCGNGGDVKAVGNSLVVTSTEATLLVAAQTTFRHDDPEMAALVDITRAPCCSSIFDSHIADYRSLYNRMSLKMYPDESSIPTDERILRQADPGLISLYHNYGRYLLISSSRPGNKPLPITLQGLWNPFFAPPWGSKYTININLQMNYWPASVCNLSECEAPFYSLLERIAERGEKTAREMYGCEGWAAHHNTDIWADTDPQDRWMPSSLWPLGGAWLCTHIWQSFLFNQDMQFLERMFPVLKGCVEFLVQFLIEDDSGQYLVTNPSLSPENSFIDSKTGKQGTLCEGSSIDTQIIAALFENFLTSCTILSRVENLEDKVRGCLERLQPPRIGSLGQLQEWQEDYTEVEPGHRHISHLWALHPGTSISPASTPDLALACDITLKRRAEHGGGHTGWSRAWLINMHARLWQADACLAHVERLLKDSTLPNMLDVHPPFQIDGNLGGCAGIVEMLVQSHDGVIRILPACPKECLHGQIKGVKCRGGFEIGFEWQEGKLSGPLVLKSPGTAIRVIFMYSGKVVDLPAERGEHHVLEP